MATDLNESKASLREIFNVFKLFYFEAFLKYFIWFLTYFIDGINLDLPMIYLFFIQFVYLRGLVHRTVLLSQFFLATVIVLSDKLSIIVVYSLVTLILWKL